MYYDGTVYVCGKIDMTGSAVRKGQTIIAEGNVKMSGSQDLVPVEDIPFVISTGGDISFSGSNRVSAVVYAMNGDVTLSGSNKLYGCAVGRNISISGSVEVEYPLSLREREELHGGSTAGPFLTILTYTYQ